MFKPHPVLIVSSNPAQLNQIAKLALRCKFRPVLAPSLADARRILAQVHPLIVFCSDELSDGTLRHAIQTLRKEAAVPVIALSRLAEWNTCVEACSAGAFDYIPFPPPDPKETRRVLGLALHQFRREHPGQHAA